LSDVNLNNPNDLYFYANLERGSIDSVFKESITARLEDKNAKCVQLEEGHVYLNNNRMALQHERSGCPYYQLSPGNVPVVSDKKYKFKVSLDNGNQYVSGIYLPKNNLDSLKIRSWLGQKDSIIVSWDKVSSECNLELNISNHYETDAGTESDIDHTSHNVNGMNEFHIPPPYFYDKDSLKLVKMKIVLNSTVKSYPHNSFRGGILKCRYYLGRIIYLSK
jgi:hypothetical protein